MKEVIMNFMNAHHIWFLILVILGSWVLSNVFVFFDSLAGLIKTELCWYDLLLEGKSRSTYELLFRFGYGILLLPGYLLFYAVTSKWKYKWKKLADKKSEIAKRNPYGYHDYL